MKSLRYLVIPLLLVAGCSRDKGSSVDPALDDGSPAAEASSHAPADDRGVGAPPAPGSDGSLGASARDLVTAAGGASSTGLTAAPTASGEAPTPQSLYETCRDRVEGVETDGECETDADCARAGCGSEVCLPAKLAVDVMTTCEVRPCFSVLDTCGCNEGRCNWTLKTEISPSLRRHLERAGPGALKPTIVEIPRSDAQ